MSLREFENVLDKQELGFLVYSGDNSIEVEMPSIAYKPYTYPLIAQEEQHGHVTLVAYLPPASVPIRDMDKLLEYLGKKLKNTLVEFDAGDQRFVLSTFLSPGSHEEELEQFQIDCDSVTPLLLAIGLRGEWNTKFVDLIIERSFPC